MKAGEPSFGGFPPASPFVIVISGPSGAGKTVVCRRLLETDPGLVLSVSATTRPPRAHERDGVEYHFRSEEAFRREVDQGHFLEWATVHDSLYGTPRGPIDEALRTSRCPLLDVDVQGGHSVKAILPDAVLIMLGPPDPAVLESRLRGRGSDSEEVIRKRLSRAARELAEWSRYDYAVVNDHLEDTVSTVRAIVAAERNRSSRRRGG